MGTAQNTWEKPTSKNNAARLKRTGRERLKFLIGGIMILGAIGYLIFSSTVTGARFFITIDEIVDNPAYVGQTVRVSGAVIGESIEYDSENLTLAFTVSHIPAEFDDLATALHQSVNDPSLARLPVFIEDEVKPDLLQHEAQAIMTGKLGEDGVFYASELLLKCPSRFEEGAPDGIENPEVARNAG